MISRVGRVAVKLRLAATDRDHSADTHHTVEKVVIRHALDELERAIHERYGARAIVRARRLVVRWRLDLATYARPETAVELGRDLADALVAEIDATPRPQRLRPTPEANVVVFTDEDHAIAAFLADHADGREAWFHAPRVDAVAEWSAAIAAGPSRVFHIVRWLDQMDYRSPVARMLEQLAPAVAVVPQKPAEIHAQPPIIAAAERPVSHDAKPAVIASTPAHASHATGPVATSAAHETDTAEVAFSVPELEVLNADAPTSAPTQVAGLWYLARLVMQLDLAEQLWAAGVHEGDFLAHVARAIAGPHLVDDPCWRWFGGAHEHEPALRPLPEWAAAELAAGRATSLDRLAPGAPVLGAVPCLVPAEARVCEAVSLSAAAVCTLFCARLGIAPNLETVRRYLRVPGRMLCGDTLLVVIPMALIDIDLRRAGLDVDPGFLPWLGRKVELVFEPDGVGEIA